MTKGIITFKTALLQSGHDFLALNNLTQDSWTNKRYALRGDDAVMDNNSAPLAYSANINNEDDPSGYAVELLDLNIVSLPAGRLCFFMMIGARISSISLTLPLEPLSFDEMKIMAAAIDQSFEQAGYSFLRGNREMTESSFGDNRRQKLDTYAEWRIPGKEDQFEYSLQINAYDSYSSVAITTPLGPAPSLEDRRKYLIKFYASVKGDASREQFALRDARRLAINGDINKPIPLKIWLDDPNWRPENWSGKWIK